MAIVGRSTPTRNGRTGRGWKLEGKIHNGAKKRAHATANIRHLATSLANRGAYPIDRLPDRCGSFFKKTERGRDGALGGGEEEEKGGGKKRKMRLIPSPVICSRPSFTHSLLTKPAKGRAKSGGRHFLFMLLFCLGYLLCGSWPGWMEHKYDVMPIQHGSSVGRLYHTPNPPSISEWNNDVIA